MSDVLLAEDVIMAAPGDEYERCSLGGGFQIRRIRAMNTVLIIEAG
jgi:hypothetical protein